MERSKIFSKISGFSFEYPIFKDWIPTKEEILEDKNSGAITAIITLKNPTKIKFEIGPKIRVVKTNSKEKINLKALNKNLNGAYYSYKENKIAQPFLSFHSLSSCPIYIYPFLYEGDGYSGKILLHKIIETFKFDI